MGDLGLPTPDRDSPSPETMLALAQFAAGVAHDLNNHLTGILGFAAILSRSKGATGCAL